MKEKLPNIGFFNGGELPKGLDLESINPATIYTVVYEGEWGEETTRIFKIEPTPDWVLKAHNVIAGYKEMLVHGL